MGSLAASLQMPFVPTFGAKLHELVSSGHDCIGWSEDGTHVWVTNPERLARDVIPRFFGHCSYPSLSRSLHAHSFTISPGSNNTWHHMSFRRDAPALAKTIMRKRPKPNERRRPEAPQDPHVSRAPNAESALARLCEELREEEQAGETLMLTLERLQASLSSAHAQASPAISPWLTPPSPSPTTPPRLASPFSHLLSPGGCPRATTQAECDAFQEVLS